MQTKIAKYDVYTLVTNRIIELLEKGTVPWKQPWTDAGPVRNLVTQRPYRGINILLLTALGYPSNEFLTFRQVKDLGGKVKKGEKAHLVVLWLWVDDKEATPTPGGITKKKMMPRHYYVFNASQCTGIPERSNALPVKHNDPIELCERIVADMPNRPNIVHNENEAYYHVLADFINMPKMETFAASENYYHTLFHELIHSTGHESRLNRKEITDLNKYGSEPYSIEELTGEIGACFLSSHAGIVRDGLSNSAAYIQGWLKRLRNDKKFIVYATSHAQRAVDHILNVTYEPESVMAKEEAKYE